MRYAVEASIARDAKRLILSLISAKIGEDLTDLTSTVGAHLPKDSVGTGSGKRKKLELLLNDNELEVLAKYYAAIYGRTQCRRGHDLMKMENLTFHFEFRYGQVRMRRRCLACHRIHMGLDPAKRWTKDDRRKHALKHLVKPPSTHCKRGHDLRVPENVRVHPKGSRTCLVCRRIRKDYKGLTPEQLAEVSRKNLEKARVALSRKKKTHCRRGHSLDPESGNVYLDPRGARICRACAKVSHDAYIERHRARLAIAWRDRMRRKRSDPKYRAMDVERQRLYRRSKGAKVRIPKPSSYAKDTNYPLDRTRVGSHVRYTLMIMEYFRTTSYSSRRETDVSVASSTRRFDD